MYLKLRYHIELSKLLNNRLKAAKRHTCSNQRLSELRPLENVKTVHKR